MKRLLRLPADTKVLYAVFTKTRPTDYKYTLTKKRTVRWWGETDYEYGVKESRAAFVTTAENIIKRAMGKGYKYVHFEVES